jgi:hypothetical protein
MTDLEKAARQALDALELLEQCDYAQGMLTPEAEEEAWEKSDEAITALRAALAKQAEPVSCGHESCDCRGYCKREQAEPVTTPPCKGINCGATDGRSHSLECHAQHAAAIAGGRFVPGVQAEPVWHDVDDLVAELEAESPENARLIEDGRKWVAETFKQAEPVVEPVTKATLKDAFFKGFHSVKLYYGDVETSVEEEWEKFMLQAEPVAEPVADDETGNPSF